VRRPAGGGSTLAARDLFKRAQRGPIAPRALSDTIILLKSAQQARETGNGPLNRSCPGTYMPHRTGKSQKTGDQYNRPPCLPMMF
jgi:hypothetical protein